MVTVVVSHKVADFKRWLPFFEKHAEKRVPAGCTKADVYRTLEDPNNVTVLFNWKDAESFKRFGQSDDLRETMMAAGVLGQPTITILNAASTYSG